MSRTNTPRLPSRRPPTHRCRLAAILVAAGCVISATGNDEQVPWQPLFDGKTLDGWIQRGGKAHYTVEDGAIVGSTVPHTPNSFLCTRRHFGDFELELDFLVDPQLNSGIQIRSNSLPSYRNGRVHGYQVEIDPSERAWSAGIYDEARRGWLYPLKNHEAARRAFRQNQWNHVRVLAVGDSIKTWLNGVPAADLVDSMTLSGFVALQVHNTRQTQPLRVRWRNIRIRDLGRHVWRPLLDQQALEDPARWTTDTDYASLTPAHRFCGFTIRLTCKRQAGAGGLAFGGGDPLHDEHALRVLIGSLTETGGVWTGDGKRLLAAPAQLEPPARPDPWRQVTVSVHGHRVVTHIDNRQVVDVRLDHEIPPGRVVLFRTADHPDTLYKNVEYLVSAERFVGLAPPAGAVVLLRKGGGLDAWRHNSRAHDQPKWRLHDGVLTVVPGTGSLMTRRNFGDVYLHLEFKPNDTRTGWQSNGNSGVYIQRRYEVQILNSFSHSLSKRDCGAIYGIKAPDEPACKPAGQWQTYDIVFRAPRWNTSGKKTENARITVYLNGVRIHDNVEIPTKTGQGSPEAPGDAPLLLQDHGNPVQFRNIWVVPLDLSANPRTDLPPI